MSSNKPGVRDDNSIDFNENVIISLDTNNNPSYPSIIDMRNKFKEQTDLGDQILYAIDNGIRLIILNAKVKSGKSIYPRYFAAMHRTPEKGKPRIKNYFLSSYVRIADKGQFNDHKVYGLHVDELCNKVRVKSCLEHIHNDVSKGYKIILNIDELDYGSGDRGLLSNIWNNVKNNNNIHCILYSATPEEILRSDFWENTSSEMKRLYTFTPANNYCGDLTFLQHGLIYDAEPALYYNKEKEVLCLSNEFWNILLKLKSNLKSDNLNIKKKYIVILRLCYEISEIGGNKKEKRAFNLFLQYIAKPLIDKGFDIRYTETDSKFIINTEATPVKIDWGKRSSFSSFSKPTIYLIDSTCTRSTELKIHDYIYAWHEYRPLNSYAIATQSQQRVVHYTGRNYDSFQKIHVYGNIDSWRLSAKLISEEEYLTKDIELSFYRSIGFDHNSIIKEIKKNKIPNINYLEKTSNIDPCYSCFRIPKQKDEILNELLVNLNTKKNELKFENIIIKHRNNIEGLAPRINTIERSEIVIVKKEFIPWPINNGNYVSYGNYKIPGTYAYVIHEKRRKIQGLDEDSKLHFRPIILEDILENTLNNIQKEEYCKKGIHTKGTDNKYIGFFEAQENGEHRSFNWSEIENSTTGKETARQTLCYKDGILGVGLRIPTGDIEYLPKTSTSKKSMYPKK